jgi:hypothetical protein
LGRLHKIVVLVVGVVDEVDISKGKAQTMVDD